MNSGIWKVAKRAADYVTVATFTWACILDSILINYQIKIVELCVLIRKICGRYRILPFIILLIGRKSSLFGFL